MIVNIGAGVAPVNIAFSSSRCAALIERQILQKTILSIKLYHCTLNEIKTQVFPMSDVLACVSMPCPDQKQHSNWDFLSKSIENMLQTCVDTANETIVKSQFFCSLLQYKCAGSTMFLITIVLSN